MKHSFYKFSLMAFTALSLTLAGCDNPEQDTADAQQSVVPTATIEETPAAAVTQAAPVVHAEGATAYATAEGTTTGAIFMTLHNAGRESDSLIAATTAKAGSTELHESYVDEASGTMSMRKVTEIIVEPGQQVTLKPDGLHIMLMNLTAPLVQGETFDVTLDFEKAPDVTTTVTVSAPGSMGSSVKSGMDHSGHGGHEGHEGHMGSEPSATDGTATTGAESLTAPESAVATDTPASSETPAETTQDTAAPATDAPAADEQPAE